MSWKCSKWPTAKPMADCKINYGPLTALIGTWQGDKGIDVSPEPEGDERSAFHERIVFEAIGDVTNAEQQDLAALRYHQVVTRQSDGKVFHNETGYLLWDESAQLVMQTLTIPRGVALIAGGKAEMDDTSFEVQAADGDPDWNISQSPFMRDHAKTKSFRHRISLEGDALHYDETMIIDIYGKQFIHTDSNELHRA